MLRSPDPACSCSRRTTSIGRPQSVRAERDRLFFEAFEILALSCAAGLSVGPPRVPRPDLTDEVGEGETLARVSNVFGDVIAEYVSPIDGVVVGRSVNPIYQTGARVVHIGRPATHAQFERWGGSELL